MAIRKFPPVEDADDYGLLAVGGDLEVPSLLLAYRSGIFPWPLAGSGMLAWFSPPQRAVLYFDRFHMPRSLTRSLRRLKPEFRIDSAFKEVVEACAKEKGRSKKGTWITKDMKTGYQALHEAGYAHSVECYLGGRLAGGVYGVSIGGMFAAESMFYREPDASKMSLCFLIEHLSSQGLRWLDCQQVTPLLSRLGAAEVTRERYLAMLKDALARPDPVSWTKAAASP